MALRLIGGLLVGTRLELVLSTWFIFGLLPEESLSQGQERGARASVLVIWDIPVTTILGAVAGLVAAFIVRGSRWAGWGTVVACCVIAAALLDASSPVWNWSQQWLLEK